MAALPRRKNCLCSKAAYNVHDVECTEQYLREIQRWLEDKVVLARVEYARLTSQAGEGMRF